MENNSTKETLAKLMATENITVEHTSKINTAAFNLNTRKLLLPLWKNISDDVYTLLISHEVGHALYTPADQWNIVIDNDKSLKDLINIVEDVRIEKLIQAKFPGTIRSFKIGYNELEQNNLFGTKDKDINDYHFLDRLNLHFKIGHFGYAKVPFSSEEIPWIQKVSSCISFLDVIRVAKELKQFLEVSEETQNSEPQSSEDSDIELSSEDSSLEDSNDSNSEDTVESNKKTSSTNVDNIDDQNQTSDSETDQKLPDSTSQNENLISTTQNHFDSSLKNYVNHEVNDVIYCNLPTLDLKSIIVDYKTVHNQISSYFSRYDYIQSTDSDIVENFKSSNMPIVNQLVTLFEMKKRAKLHAKIAISNTGKLDTNKIHSYRYNDDIFKKSSIIPEGKSHGLVMFLDMSGSMNENMKGTYEQLLNLVLFCRKANIPFDVYGFTDNTYSRTTLKPMNFKENDLAFVSAFSLRHYFSNKMNSKEFNTALKNIILLMRQYDSSYRYLPNEEHLHQTPMIPAIITAKTIVENFRKEYALDIVNTIILSDGDDTHGIHYVNDGVIKSDLKSSLIFSPKSALNQYFIRDTKTHKQWKVSDNSTATCLNILKETAGVKIIAFDIIKKSTIQYALLRHGIKESNSEKLLNTFKTDKYCEVNNVSGYDAYYYIPSDKNLNIESDEFNADVNIDWDNQKSVKKGIKSIAKKFDSFMKKKVVSRILLNRFIEQIS